VGEHSPLQLMAFACCNCAARHACWCGVVQVLACECAWHCTNMQRVCCLALYRHAACLLSGVCPRCYFYCERCSSLAAVSVFVWAVVLCALLRAAMRGVAVPTHSQFKHWGRGALLSLPTDLQGLWCGGGRSVLGQRDQWRRCLGCCSGTSSSFFKAGMRE